MHPSLSAYTRTPSSCASIPTAPISLLDYTHEHHRPTIVAGLGYSGGQAQLHTGTLVVLLLKYPLTYLGYRVQFHHMSLPLF